MGQLIYLNHKKTEKILASGGDLRVLLAFNRGAYTFPRHLIGTDDTVVLRLGAGLTPAAPVVCDEHGFCSRVSISGVKYDIAFAWANVLSVSATFPPSTGGTPGRKAA